MMKLAVLVIAVGLLSLENNSYGQISRLRPAKITKRTESKTKGAENEKLLQKIFENNQKTKALIEQRSRIPVVWEGNSKIVTGKVFRGVLLNAINSTNITSPVLVEGLPNQGLPFKARFSCHATTQNKRVLTLCNRMITNDEEISISAQLLNTDGSSGLMGNYEDGKEDLIVGAVASEFSAGVLSIAQARIAGPYGSITDSSGRNQIYQGLIESGRTTSDILLDEMKTREPIITVEAGKEVLIYFMEALRES